MKEMLQNLLTKINLLDKDQNLSITNLTVALFISIAALRMLLGGSDINLGLFIWKVQVIETSDTLPVLFSLLNYSHKRMIINNNNGSQDAKSTQ